jgi:hypothetical protein
MTRFGLTVQLSNERSEVQDGEKPPQRKDSSNDIHLEKA